MIDALGNELKKGDLVAFAKPTGSNARMHLAVVTDPQKNAIFSMYTYYIGDKLQKVYNTRQGVNVSSWKLLQFDAANDSLIRQIHAELKEKAAKYL